MRHARVSQLESVTKSCLLASLRTAASVVVMCAIYFVRYMADPLASTRIFLTFILHYENAKQQLATAVGDNESCNGGGGAKGWGQVGTPQPQPAEAWPREPWDASP